VNGKKDALGRTIDESSLKFLLGNCDDFINEESMLQYYGHLMGVAVDWTLKCHCELAGEGIEYSWAASKNKVSKVSCKGKKGKRSVPKFGKWVLIKAGNNNNTGSSIFKKSKTIYLRLSCIAWSAADRHWFGHRQQNYSAANRKTFKKFKTHRTVIDFDNRFVAASVKMEEGEDAN
jgi:hypothetical protein